ncbi:MAG TPA: PPOX class F420-dependent oxidoreductase [Phototrophicaceae bacterium]|nr:PPOX class F420-dependent oxidoreductase [Phototrophicaceae bacterium]
MVPIPDSHRDLIDGQHNAALTTILPNGQPQTTPVWCNREGGCLCVNTMRGFQKEKNMRANPKVTLLAYDTCNPLHYIEIRGIVIEMTEVDALEHLNRLTSKYLGKPAAQFFGDSVSAELRTSFTPVKVRIMPTRVRTEG